MKAAKVEDQPKQSCSSVHHDPYTYTGNWAGHVVPKADYFNNALNWSESSIVVPSVPHSGYVYPWYCAPATSFWVGTDGAPSNNHLIQAGFDSIEQYGANVYEFWKEDFPNAAVMESTPAISPGNIAYVYEGYQGSNITDVYFENLTTGHWLSDTMNTPYVGDVRADFVNERLICLGSGNGGQDGFFLPNFGSAKTTGNYFGGFNTSYTLDPSKNSRFVMTSDCTSTGKVLSEPNGVNSDGYGSGDFTHYFYAQSPYKNNCNDY